MVVEDEDETFRDPEGCPEDQAENLTSNWPNVELLLLWGALHDLDELGDGTGVEDDYREDHVVYHVVAHGEQDLLLVDFQILIE